MTYFEDGTPYSYNDEPATPELVNVGWLDGSVRFQTGPLEDEFVSLLGQACLQGMYRMRGFHICNICPRDRSAEFPSPVAVELQGEPYFVGSAEIRVDGLGGRKFASPDMIIHYVQVHNYKPPEDFVKAILRVNAT